MEKVKSLKEIRLELGLSQVEMARKINMTYSNYLNYEREIYKSMSEEKEKEISEILDQRFVYAPNLLNSKEPTPEHKKTLKELREDRNITQYQMAIELDMSYNNYVNYEKGYYKAMPVEIEEKIGKILGIEYEYRRGE